MGIWDAPSSDDHYDETNGRFEGPDDSDSFFCEYAADLARWEQQRMQQEATEADPDDDEAEGAPF